MTTISFAEPTATTTAASSSTSVYRRLLVGITALTPLLLMAGVALTPHDGDEHVSDRASAARELAAATAHHDSLLAGSILVILGLGALAVAYGSIGVLAPDRGRRWATAAVVLGGVGGFCGALLNVYVGPVPAQVATTHVDAAGQAAVLIAMQGHSTASGVFAAPYFAGMIFGSICAAVALWRSRAVPRWFAGVFPVVFFVAFTASSGVQALLVVPWALQWSWLARAVHRR